MEKKFKKQIKNNFEYKKYLKERVINCTSNGKRMIVLSIVELIKNTFNSQYFPKTFRSFGGNINVKVDLSNYTIKTDLKNVTD